MDSTKIVKNQMHSSAKKILNRHLNHTAVSVQQLLKSITGLIQSVKYLIQILQPQIYRIIIGKVKRPVAVEILPMN